MTKNKVQKQYNKYVATMQKRADIESAIAVLSWDKEVNLPDNSARFRSQQVATLSGMSHEIFTATSFGKLLINLKEAQEGLDDRQKKNIALTHKEYERSKKLSKAFVIRKSKAISAAYHAWLKARAANDFQLYKKELGLIIDIAKEEAELIGYEDHPYDALLDVYEPDACTSDLTVLFKDVRAQLVAFVKQLKKRSQIDNDFLFKKYGHKKQWEYGLKALENMGYDFKTGRQDISCLLYTSPSPRDATLSRMPSSA